MRRLVGFALPNSVRSVCSIKARVRCAPTMRNASDASAAAIHETVLECTRASLRAFARRAARHGRHRSLRIACALPRHMFLLSLCSTLARRE